MPVVKRLNLTDGVSPCVAAAVDALYTLAPARCVGSALGGDGRGRFSVCSFSHRSLLLVSVAIDMSTGGRITGTAEDLLNGAV